MTGIPSSAYPLVAVVTPVYNGAKFLAETMESVQQQTYPNIIHVILDNASTDATPEIIASFRDRRVPLLVARNDVLLAMDDNWNAALKLIPADAAYFTVVCADDALKPESTARMVELGESDKAITVLSSEVLRNGQLDPTQWPQDRTVFDGDEATRLYFTGGGAIDCRQMMMRREALRSADPFFDDKVVFASDIDAALRLLRNGKLGFIHEPLMLVRDNETTETAKEVKSTHLHFCSWLMTIQRHARSAFGEEGYSKLHRRYRRFYLRRMLLWRWVDGNARAYRLHIKELRKINSEPRAWEFVDALGNWILLKFKGERGWHGYPS